MAYGTFGMLYGVSWGIGGLILTFLLQLQAPIIVGYAVLTQALSLIMLVALNRQLSQGGRATGRQLQAHRPSP